MRRFVRAVVVGVILIVSCAACEINARLAVRVSSDGSGSFSLRFLIDKELVDLARLSGEDPFGALACPAELEGLGWRCGRTNEGGGVAITLDRSFRDPKEFNDAMDRLKELAAEQGATATQFFSLQIERTSGFLRTRTSVVGDIDLTSTGALENVPEGARRQLQAIIEQAAGEFFTFRLEVALPGKVSKAEGSPERVDGGTATWTPRLGKRLSFGAESSAYNVGSIALLGVPTLVIVGLLARALISRRRRRTRAPAQPG